MHNTQSAESWQIASMSMPDELNILELHRPLESGRMRGNGRDTEHVPAQQ